MTDISSALDRCLKDYLSQHTSGVWCGGMQRVTEKLCRVRRFDEGRLLGNFLQRAVAIVAAVAECIVAAERAHISDLSSVFSLAF